MKDDLSVSKPPKSYGMVDSDNQPLPDILDGYPLVMTLEQFSIAFKLA